VRNKIYAKAALSFILLAAVSSMLLLCLSCSGSTAVQIKTNLLSFFVTEEKKVDFWLPPYATFHFYFLPGYQIDKVVTGPNKTQAGGLLVNLPDTAEIPFHSAFTIVFSGKITIRNLNSSGVLRLVNLSVHVAPEEIEDIYASGEILVSIPVDDIDPGKSADIDFGFEIAEDSAYAEIFESSVTRIGIKLKIPESTGELMHAGYELTRLELSVSGKPFSLIPD